MNQIVLIKYSSKFQKSYKKLLLNQKVIAERCEAIFRNDPFDSRLRTHKLKGQLKNYWSFSITHSHRIVFKFINKNEVMFYDIGDHRIYQ
jgi:mRNA-degrading endonuclease YafQ of YafQ-DinJ toxin-antitoxin module